MGKKIAWCLALVGLLLLVGCAAGGSSDNTKDGGFYGGVSGGWSRP